MLDDTIDSDDDSEDLYKSLKVKKPENIMPKNIIEKYFVHINPYEIPSPDYLFMLGRIRDISDRRA